MFKTTIAALEGSATMTNRWQVRIGITESTISYHELTEGGPDFEDINPDEVEIVSEAKADTEFTVAYYQGKAVLIDEAENCAYIVPPGAIYYQRYLGRAFELGQYREDDGEMTRDPISWEDLGDADREWFHTWMAEDPENNTPEALAAELSGIWPGSDEQELLEFLHREALEELTL